MLQQYGNRVNFSVFLSYILHSVQFSSVAQSCPTLRDPMNRSTPGLPVNLNQIASLYCRAMSRHGWQFGLKPQKRLTLWDSGRFDTIMTTQIKLKKKKITSLTALKMPEIPQVIVNFCLWSIKVSFVQWKTSSEKQHFFQCKLPQNSSSTILQEK